MKTSKIIFHIDMNCFYASCEIAQNDELKGKPIVVAHADTLRKSIILSPSYEARAFGIKTTMLVRDALRLCNDLIVVEPDMNLYNQYSKMFFDFLYKITPNIEIASIDEGYLDVTEICEKINAIELANRIQKTLYDKYKLPCSIGIAPNKFLAKMASDMKKPFGITVLRKREIDKYMWPLSISKMFGVGKKTSPRLEELGIKTIGDLANYKDLESLKKVLGPSHAESLIERANGIDNSIVDTQGFNDVLSISNSYTFDIDQNDELYIKNTLRIISNTVSNRLQKKELKAQTIGIQIKYSNFKQINRSKGLEIPVNEEIDVYKIVEDLFEEFYDDKMMIRLVGVFATRLIESKNEIKQYSIFDNLSELEKESEVQRLLNNMQRKFGKDSIARGYYKYESNE